MKNSAAFRWAVLLPLSLLAAAVFWLALAPTEAQASHCSSYDAGLGWCTPGHEPARPGPADEDSSASFYGIEEGCDGYACPSDPPPPPPPPPSRPRPPSPSNPVAQPTQRPSARPTARPTQRPSNIISVTSRPPANDADEEEEEEEDEEDEDEDESSYRPPPPVYPTPRPTPRPTPNPGDQCVGLGGTWQHGICVYPPPPVADPDNPLAHCRCVFGMGVPGLACRQALTCTVEPVATPISPFSPLPVIPPSGPPTLNPGPDFGSASAICGSHSGRFADPLSPLNKWIDPVIADVLAAQSACTHTGTWLEKQPYVRGWSFTPPQPVLWSQSQHSNRPGSPTVQVRPRLQAGRLITCATVGRPPTVTTPAVQRVAIEITFTQASIDEIVSGSWQQQFPGAYVHQSATAYCRAGAVGQALIWDQQNGELIDPGQYEVRVRACTAYACHQTDVHDLLQMQALVVAPAAD